ncbi:pyridoxamine 5'-phosphate oxidase [Haloactinopolyspora alba]|uniref:Pyridoxamine 5'-phosphate oxidase n=1 Tax=Haloactinopolyspora alba TaxID=648780 RepID=A0A2P8DN35_9ACTN|nr:phenazine biosynthesis FMN-dependent oxidase PhzG [Haloactinopolyspora alba]PSK98632.1 pyridoxamine 5'-phosphate oxidase [Haloactinopolyspora alba]
MTIETLSGDELPDLPEFDDPPEDPVGLVRSWLDAAVRRGVREPHAAALATADAAGRPSNRTLLVKEVTDRGLTFTTDSGSGKGADLAVRPYAATVFYWRETLQQIRVSGVVTQLSDEVSDTLFAERPVEAQATTAASAQSRPLDSDAELRDRAEKLAAAGDSVPRPETWRGYLLTADMVEFWQGRASRLHRRLRYERGDESWSARRLQP